MFIQYDNMQVAKDAGMVTVKWKHSASCNEWRGVDGPSSPGFLVLNRPPNVLLQKTPMKVPVHAFVFHRKFSFFICWFFSTGDAQQVSERAPPR